MKPPFPNTPQGFLGSPALPGHRSQPPPVRMVEVRPPAPGPPGKRTHQTEARVHVRLPDQVELNRETLHVTRLHIAGANSEASCADIIAPRRGVSNEWLLDTRPTTRCRLQAVAQSGRVFFRTRLLLPAAAFQAGGPGTTARRSRLSFRLGEEIQEQVCVRVPATAVSGERSYCALRGTGVYRLLPV